MIRKYILFLLLVCIHGLARGQTTEYTGFYWFDNEQRVPTVSPTVQGTFDVDASSLTDGLHTFHYIVAKKDGGISQPSTNYFVKMSSSSTSLKGFYWFDNEPTAYEATTLNGMFEVDASTLSDGFHQFSYIATQGNGGLAKPASCYFMKTAQVSEEDSLTCICSVDGLLRHVEKLSQQGGVIHWSLDMLDLADGIHQIQLQAVTKSGALSSSYSSYFMRVTSNEELNEMRCIYAIDNESFHAINNVVSNNGNYHFDLDLSELSDGLHYVSFLLHNDRGTISKVQTRFFLKVPLGGNGIDQYQYWLNEDDVEQARTVTLPEKVNPLQLMSLLSVESRPFRSSLFHFDVSSGKPMAYAKNTIHLRFYDVAMRFTDVAKDYTDFSVSQEVNILKTLEPGVSETTTWPEENEIKWYQVTAERGDSLRFKLDHAATLQLFAPSGKEVYNVSGAESVFWGGLHAAESGTFYVALHDVTATQGEDICIDYEHIDKYAVLRQDVAIVGNGGCSTITFEGNGFRDLYGVDLYNEQGDSIKHIHIGHESDATTSVVFDFTDVALGKYNAIFHFTGEDKMFSKLITVEEAVDIELATTVTYPSMFLRGTSTTYTIKITNKGNITAYSVPIYTFIKSPSKNSITRLKYEGVDLADIFNYSDNDSLSDEEMMEIRNAIESMGDIIHFMNFHVKDESTGDSVWVRSNYFFQNIAPHETKTLRLVLNSIEEVQAYFTIPKELYPLSSSEVLMPQKVRNRGLTEHLCCYHDRYECVLNVFTNVADWTSLISTVISLCPAAAPASGTVAFASGVASCVSGAFSQGVYGISLIMCNSEDSLWEKLKALINMKSTISIGAAIWNCWGMKLKKVKGLLKAISDVTADVSIWNYTTASDCVKAWTEQKPNCPPNSDGGGGSSTPQPPSDPNDIYGYLSDAGSKFMTDEVAKVNYTIEFENDTAFAQASAHTIVIRDTLDSRYFALKSFLPTRVKIGEREAFLDEAADVKTAGGVSRFLKTIDMRPEIYAIAQVEGEYSQQTGIAKWTFTSLDPMTMEPTDDLMQGILPVNYNGTSGIGEVMFEVGVKPNKADGTQIPNRAGIVFDYEEPIMTPTWTNVIDRIAPESHVTGVKMLNDSTAAVSIEATDELSGPWRYDVYVQYGTGSAWVKMAESVPIDTTASIKVYEGINHGFYVVVTDSAGNVEQKEAAREYTFEVFAPQVDTNTKLQLAQGWNWVSHNQQEALSAESLKPKAQRIVSQTDELYKDSRFGWTGTLDELLPTQMYKVQMAEADEVQLGGRLFNAAFRAVPLYAGWNWIGYPVAQTMTPAEALQKMEAEEDDAIIGRDGLVTYSDGEWTGTLAEMVSGQGYMYRSASDKSLFLNATAQASSRAVHKSRTMADGQWPEDWTVDRQRYPNVMGIVAELWQDGKPVEDSGEWLLGAFCDGECRGLAETVGSHLMMNVYGRGGEKIEFFVMHRESGEILPVSESEEFRADLLGTVRQPYQMNMGVLTGISDATRLNNNGQIINNNWYDLQGRRLSVSSASSENSVLPKGVYIVTDGQKKGTQKVVRR